MSSTTIPTGPTSDDQSSERELSTETRIERQERVALSMVAEDEGMTHTCELIERHRIMLPVVNGDVQRAGDAARAVAQTWAEAVGVEVSTMLAALTAGDERETVGVEFTLTLGRTEDVDNPDAATAWSDRAKAWVVPFLRLGRVGVFTTQRGGANGTATNGTGRTNVVQFPQWSGPGCIR